MRPSEPDIEAIQETFLEFWSHDLCKLAIPHIEVKLDDAEYAAIALCHRFGRPERKRAAPLLDVADRLEMISIPYTEGYFLRLGYGSWSASQLPRFGTLRIGKPMNPLDVLCLKDARLATIARRYVRHFTPSLFVRPYFPGALAEIRVPVDDQRSFSPFWREPRLRIEKMDDALSEAALALVFRARLFLPKIPLHVDVIQTSDRLWIVDVNPRL